ncbi:probable serine/threonine-protein kinase At1g54610 [Chenopodium quinoa]|uniref:Protein kinase domain-containing protein n=1 Tax=Chenopodium quinoa TaxID=63459 RepID=A0A803MS45_CHEQI|nr:probable serine/threonine-protein kinase At1g54610 [Chenopodium quinoa]
MGCICSTLKESSGNNEQREVNKSQVHLLPSTTRENSNGFGDGSTRSRPPSRVPSGANLSGSLSGSSRPPSKVNSGTLSNGYSSSLSNKQVDDQGEKPKTIIVERPSSRGSHHRRGATVDLGVNGGPKPVNGIVSIPRGPHGEQVIAGWPSWLSSVAGEAIHGWVPRRADSFEKLDKIGQGTYSSVYKARDLETGKLVAMKKVRFVNMDPESVRFMAREILILRKLDHPNVMKLEGLVTSRMSGSLYLVFEYMEHDLAGLLARPGNRFTEPQIKCYMQQLLSGLVHCHSRGVLHRDIKGSNLLINNDGVLKIADFGLATCFKPGQKQPLTSRVVTLWYRAPELLLGSTNYGIAVDMWSVGCIVAELFAGKPIMPGRTEVEQMHKIFKLCGSPSELYWKRTKFPHATSFKPSQPYKRRLMETFKDFPASALTLVDALLSIEPERRGTASAALKSEFFTTHPLPCDPLCLPKCPPTKEFDIKVRDEEARRRKADAVKGRGPESVRRGPRDSKPTPEYDANGEVSLKGDKSARNYNAQGNGGNAFTVDAQTRNTANGLSHCSSMVHPSAVGSAWNRKAKDENDAHQAPGRAYSASKDRPDSRSQKHAVTPDRADSYTRDDWPSGKDNGYVPKKNRIHYSGPLVPPGGNIEDMLKEHERQIQQAVRKSRMEKARNKTNNDVGEVQLQYSNGRNGW